jgi:hypothetical protein
MGAEGFEMKSTHGFWQEVQTDGSSANSFMRLLETMFFVLLCGYMFVSNQSYESHFNQYVQLLKDKCITEQSFNMLITQLSRIDWDIFSILVIATVVPKAIQKFTEAKTGIKSTTETESSSSSKTVTQ